MLLCNQLPAITITGWKSFVCPGHILGYKNEVGTSQLRVQHFTVQHKNEQFHASKSSLIILVDWGNQNEPNGDGWDLEHTFILIEKNFMIPKLV